MWANVAGSVFWSLLVLFPVTVPESSPGCVTYQHRNVCSLKGSFVYFPCTYSKNARVTSISGWSKKLNPEGKVKPLEQISTYSSRLQYNESGNNDCTLKLMDLKTSDRSIYYFIYSIRDVTGHYLTCRGDPGVRLWVFDSAVSIHVKVPVSWKTGQTVMEGQKMSLTCDPQCDAHLKSNPGYIWYKNKKRLKDSGANLLSFESIRNEDSGSYFCAMIGREDLPSTAVNIRVRRKQSDPVLSTRTPTKDNVPTLTHTTENTEQTFNISQQPKNRGVYRISMILLSSVCVGLITGLTVTVLVYKVKQKKKMRRCADSANKPPAPNNDFYMALHVGSMSAEYDTLNASETVYENLCQPGEINEMKERFQNIPLHSPP